MSYELQPGTIAFLCAKHLRTLPPCVELSTAELSAALGQPSSSLLPLTQAARNHGLIRARYRDDNKRHLWWSIGDGTPLPAPAAVDGESDDAPLGKPFKAPPISMRSVFDIAQDIPVFTNTPPPDAATEAAQVAGKSELAEGHADQRPPRDGVVRFALWSDGKLQVVTAAGCIVLAREETQALIDYLDVMHGREVAA